MNYSVIIYGELKGMNELLNGRFFDPRTHKYKNPVKQRNDYLCIAAIRKSTVANVQITKPVILHYKFFAKDKKHDRFNLFSAIDKSFEDALQKAGVLRNDGWDDVLNATHEFYIDRENPRVEVVIEEVYQ
jgi:Holliday junction resolvase RusA-like endonuclease